MSKLKEKQPKVALLESIRSIGYNFNSALADIIDNSISAKAKNVDIFLVEAIPAIVICDDGYGMTKEELDDAMDLGSKNPEDERDINDLGRFGLGLKSASFSQCKELTVTSLKNGEISSMTWDLNLVQKESKWLIKENDTSVIDSLLYVSYIKNAKHGTIVEWKCFDRIGKSNTDILLALSQKLSEANKYLSLVFHKYIINKSISIRINGNVLPECDPFLSKRHDTQKLKTEEIVIKNNNDIACLITVTPYILPFIKNLTPSDFDLLGGKDSIRNNQGFYIYRNNRLIIWGTWLHLTGMNELYKNARIEVNIPNSLDDLWEVDVKKASASIPGIIKQQLFAAVKKAIGTSKKVYQKRSTNLSEERGYEVVWNVSEERDTFDFKINRNLPLLQQLKSMLDEDQTSLLDAFISDVENNIPKMKIFTSVAESRDKDTNLDELDQIRNNISDILNTMKMASNIDQIQFLEMLFQSEPYCRYLDLLDELKGALNND